MATSTPHKSRSIHTPDLDRDVDVLELADCLEFARETLGSDSSLPEETRRELNRSLGYAEAALRRAAAEKTIFVRIKDQSREN